MQNPQAESQKGFTFPEVLIVLIIIAILAVIALPQLFSSVQLNRILTASSLITNKLSEAKMLAVKQNKNISLVIDETDLQVWLESNSTVIGSKESLPSGIKVKVSPNTSATKEYITFSSMGTLVTTPSTVLPYYEARSLEHPINVSISGKITRGEMRNY
ncbi:MAG: prepilin-type N-terminal cleavage/methylation domain-containing protein [Acidobacteriota bacterium]